MVTGSNRRSGKKGFTLIEIVVVLAILAILVGLLVPSVYSLLQRKREAATEQELDSIKKAIIGNPAVMSGAVRTDYGYLGDMGIVPGQGDESPGADDIKKLIIRGDQPAYLFSSKLRIGGGWEGPYLQGSSEAEVTLDQFRSTYLYQVRNPTGLATDDWVAEITSPGPDKTRDTSDDISVEIKKKESFAKVFGYVRTKGDRPVPYVPVTLYYPDARLSPAPDVGILTTQTTLSNSDGFYEFQDVPFGVRSVMIEPRLVYAEGSAKTKGNGSHVEFYVTNYSALNVEIVRVMVDYNIVDSAGNTAAFYDEFKLGGKTLFKATGPNRQRKGPGEPIDVSPPIVVNGTGQLVQPIVVHVSESSTRVPDIDISTVKRKAGGAIKGEIKRFRDQRSKGGKPVDVTGVEFTVTFTHADGARSLVVFTPTGKEKKGTEGEKFRGVTRLVLGYDGSDDISKARVSKNVEISKIEGNEITIMPVSGKQKFPADITVEVGQDKEKIHTSGSQPLDEGDIFGAFVVEEIDKL